MKHMTHRLTVLMALVLLACLWLAPAVSAHAAQTCQQFGTIASGNGKFVFQNNFYKPSSNSAKQCIDVSDANHGKFSISNTGNLPNNGSPGGYPSVFMGCHWGTCSNNKLSNMPAQVSDLKSINSAWGNNAVGSGAWDIAYDIWFNQSPSTGGQPNGTEIMVWLNDKGGVQPAGSKAPHNVTINGINFEVWTAPKGCCGFNGTWNIVSYRATSPRGWVNFSLLPFINDSVNRGLLKKAWWLIDVEAGFEPWRGGTGLTSTYLDVWLTKYSQR